MLVMAMDEKLTLTEMVQNAMGQSVTPSRLKESRTPGILEKLLGTTEIPGPFYSDLRPGESPHYLFRTDSGIRLSEEEGTHNEGEFGISIGSHTTAVVVITDRRSILFYSVEDERKQISLKHTDLVNVEFNNGILINKMILTTTQVTVETSVSIESSYSSELSDASAYIAEQAGIEEETTGFGFEDGNVDSAGSALRDQLSSIDEVRDQIDISKVVSKATTGARIGIKRGKITGALGLVVYGGIEIWSQLNESDETDLSVEDLDPEETAEEIAKWQEIGRTSEYKGTELANGALGAAISVDKQTSGREVSRILSDLDIDWVSRQLEEGNQKDTAIQVTSEVEEAYSTELSWLFNQQPSDDSSSL